MWRWHYCGVLLVVGKFCKWISIIRFYSCTVNLHYTTSLTAAIQQKQRIRDFYTVTLRTVWNVGILSSHAAGMPKHTLARPKLKYGPHFTGRMLTSVNKTISLGKCLTNFRFISSVLLCTHWIGRGLNEWVTRPFSAIKWCTIVKSENYQL